MAFLTTEIMLTVVLVAFSLIMSNAEHLLLCQLAIGVSSLESSTHLLLSCMNYFCILEIKSLVASFVNIFSQSIRRVSLHFAYGFLCCVKSLQVWVGPICLCLLLFLLL